MMSKYLMIMVALFILSRSFLSDKVAHHMTMRKTGYPRGDMNVADSVRSHLTCRHPTYHHDMQEEPKYIIFGLTYPTEPGLGDYFLNFASIYYFAAITGRILLIQDDAAIGSFCRTIHCGFPLAESIVEKFRANMRRNQNSSVIMHRYFLKHRDDSHLFLQGKHPEQADIENAAFITIRINGYSDEDVYYRYNETIECADRLSGCTGAFSVNGNCHSRYALHQLIQGPMFRNKAFVDEVLPNLMLYHHHADKVFNMTEFDRAITSDSVFEIPRVDVGVHMRMLFYNFENPDLGSTTVESQSWLDSSARDVTFQEISKKLRQYVLADMKSTSLFDYNRDSRSSGLVTSHNNHQQRHAGVFTSERNNSRMVYLAVDDLNIKRALFHYLKTSEDTADLHLSYLYLNASLVHSGRLHSAKEDRQAIDDAMVGMTYDWLLLAFAGNLVGYRESDSALAGRPNMGYGEDSSFRMSGRLFTFLPYFNLQVDPLQNNTVYWTSKVFDEMPL